MTLRNRFVLSASIIALLTLSGAFAAVWLGFAGAQERQRDWAIEAEARDEAQRASYADDWKSSERFDPPPGELGGLARYAAIYDSGGRAVAWTRNLERARPALSVLGRSRDSAFDFWWNNEHLRCIRVDVPGGAGQSLWLATPRTDLDVDAASLVRGMAAAVAIAVAAAAAAAAWLAKRLTRHHERMAAVARAVAAGDLSARVGDLSSSDRDTVQLAHDLDDMISRLAVLMETQQRFIANASHELRSPLTMLLGELSFAAARERDAAAYRTSIEEALQATRRLKTLAEDLLAMARVGAEDVELEPVSLLEVTSTAVESSRPTAESAGVALDATSDGAVVQGRPRDLERLMRNLIENAVRHSPPGGRVRVEAHRQAQDARVVVSDDGPGVPAVARERIFEPFFRLDAGHSGAGLGLAIGRSIARAHGGDLWVDSAPGVAGARFIVSLPLSGPTRRGAVQIEAHAIGR